MDNNFNQNNGYGNNFDGQVNGVSNNTFGLDNQFNNQQNMFNVRQNNMCNNQPNMMNQQQNNQAFQTQKKSGSFLDLCCSTILNFIIFTIAVFIFGGLIYSVASSVFGFETSYKLYELMEENVAFKFCNIQIYSAIVCSGIYALLYMLSIKYIVKSRLKRKNYSLKIVKNYKIVVIIMSILMFLVMNFGLVRPIDEEQEKVRKDIDAVGEYFETPTFDKVISSYGIARNISLSIIGGVTVLTILLALVEIKKNENLLSSAMNYNTQNNVANNNYV